MDKQIHKVLNNLKIKSILITINNFENFLSDKKGGFEESHNLRKLWLLRGLIFKKIIDADVNIIHCDSDAFWLKNIYPLVDNLQYDISISIAYGMPKVAIRKWRFSLCNGFFMIKSNPHTKAFMKKYWDLLSKVGHDQAAMNQILLRNDIKWRKKSNIENEGYVKKLRLRVKVISDNIICRSSTRATAGVYIYHPFLVGGIEKKLKFLKENLQKVEIKSRKAA
ncbi:MAG: hypothetical protein JRI96_14520 [Deltaproteobacteria bacterium]|nr:hypothetical protein [Deltaproteobacteria bacterium]